MEYVAVLLPSVCLAVLFYFVIKAIFNADRAEREAMAKAEELQDAEDARGRAAADEKKDNPEIDPR
ncbi:hypothetical protein ACX80N_08540 [Arthrobacter sp. MDT2-16]|uniref:hypothetical protein n=1 Tax=Arthrobacter ruber TaxID=1258893 RepID=UPI000CF55D49|nr:hypothetical protein [Arthrobacter ruber]